MNDLTRAPDAAVVKSASVAVWLVAAHALLMTGAYLVFRSTPAMVAGNELSVERSIFASVNAGTLTGFQQGISVRSYLLPAQIAVFVLMLSGTFVALTVGTLAVARILNLPYSTARVLGSAAVAQIIATALGMAVVIGAERPPLEAAFQAASAFGNCGLYLGTMPGVSTLQTQLLLMLAIAGGLGLPVLMELFDSVTGWRKPSAHTRVCVAVTCGLFVVSFVVLLGFQWPKNIASVGSWHGSVASALTASLNCRTAGLPIESVGTWPRAMQWTVMVLMMIGTSPAGTGGGIKTTTLAQLFRGTRDALYGMHARRVTGIAMVWIAAYLSIIVIATAWLLAMLPEMPADRVLFMVVSAASNVGLSHDPLAMRGPALYVLSGTMLIGRFAPLIVLWWMAHTTTDADLAIG
ncbi:MAG: potassium transporter TrkG [Tepidisphaeraceae bacterium]